MQAKSDGQGIQRRNASGRDTEVEEGGGEAGWAVIKVKALYVM